MAPWGTKVRALIVSDHPLVLAGVEAILRDDVSVEVVGTAVSAGAALDLVSADCPDVVVLDVRLAENSGYELMTEMRRSFPLAEFVALATSDDADSFRHALDRGAHGYLLDSSSREDLRLAVQRVAAGKSHIDPAVSGHLVPSTTRGSGHADSLPTTRELDVLRLAADGMTNDAIARRLNLKTETVKTHMSRAFERIGARDRAHAVAICMRRGWF